MLMHRESHNSFQVEPNPVKSSQIQQFRQNFLGSGQPTFPASHKLACIPLSDERGSVGYEDENCCYRSPEHDTQIVDEVGGKGSADRVFTNGSMNHFSFFYSNLLQIPPLYSRVE